METIPLYLIKVVFSSAVLFGYYHLFLRDKTFHHYNRFYLLSAVVISLLLPLLKVSYFTIELNNNFYLLLSTFQNNETIKNTNNDYLYFTIAYSVFGLVAVVLLIKILAGILKIESFKKQFPKEKIEGISFYQTNLEDAPFSYFRNLFWKNSIILQSDLGRQILKHEMIHIEQKHSFDKIMMELVTAIFWFNPFFWFIKKEINLIHEYLADKKAVKQSDTQAFAQMLLASHFASTSLPGTSPFLSSNLKKRLKMLQKSKTKYSYARKILALPLLFAIGFAYLVKAENKEIEKSNEQIKAQVSELKKDTITATAQLVKSENGVNPISNQAKEATEEALFIVNGKEVSKNIYLNFLKKNHANQELVTSYHDPKLNDEKHSIFGERGKYGVFGAELISKMNKNSKDYKRLIEKYNPNWFKNIKNNEMSKSDSQFKGINKSDKILNPNNKEITKLDFGNFLEDAPYISESVKVVIQNNFNEMFSKAQTDKNNYSVKYISENKNNAGNTKIISNEELEKSIQNLQKQLNEKSTEKIDNENSIESYNKKILVDKKRQIVASGIPKIVNIEAHSEDKTNSSIDKNANTSQYFQTEPKNTKLTNISIKFKGSSKSTKSVATVLNDIKESEKKLKTKLIDDDMIIFMNGKLISYSELGKFNARRVKSITINNTDNEKIMRIVVK